MEKRSRRKLTKGFKTETVALSRRSGKSSAEVCRDMRLPESSGQRDGLTERHGSACIAFVHE